MISKELLNKFDVALGKLGDALSEVPESDWYEFVDLQAAVNDANSNLSRMEEQIKFNSLA